MHTLGPGLAAHASLAAGWNQRLMLEFWQCLLTPGYCHNAWPWTLPSSEYRCWCVLVTMHAINWRSYLGMVCADTLDWLSGLDVCCGLAAFEMPIWYIVDIPIGLLLRTAEQGINIYKAGQMFLKQHLRLTAICSRQVFFHLTRFFSKKSCWDMPCRRCLLMWVAKPKAHVWNSIKSYAANFPQPHQSWEVMAWWPAGFFHLLRNCKSESRWAAWHWFDVIQALCVVWLVNLLFFLAVAWDLYQGLNPRFFHTFHDEDAKGWAKSVARKVSRLTLERSMLKCANLRLKMLSWHIPILNEQMVARRHR